jgi:hypothetical protein
MTEETKTDSEKKKEDWMNSKWRPMMGWMYMATCTVDFILFPVLWSLLQAVMKIGTMTQWQPLTLQGAGLFHIAMGAVLGIAAMGRTQEKLAGANNGGAATTTPGLSSSFAAPSTPSSSFGTPASSFATPSTNSAPFSPAPSWGTTPVANSAEVTTGFGGKPAPVIPPFPER